MKKLVLGLLILFILFLLPVSAQTRPRARDLGIPFDGTPGPLNALKASLAPLAQSCGSLPSPFGKLKAFRFVTPPLIEK